MSQRPFYVTGGTLDGTAPSYVERSADQELFEGLMTGDYCYVLTSRQMGKSSLMVRTANRLQKVGSRVAVLDLTALGQNLTPEQWYDGLSMHLGEDLDLEEELDTFWRAHTRLSPLQRFLRAIHEVVLPAVTDTLQAQLNSPQSQPPALVIFIDEIDAVRSLPFSTDELFAAIRECYNRRSKDPLYARLAFCLLGVASPSDLIRDPRTTPFNIGRRIELTDFTEGEALRLCDGLPGEKGEQACFLKRVLFWTRGHPYLTQRLCRAVAEQSSTVRAPGRKALMRHVDRCCDALFLSPKAREQDDNLAFVRDRLLRPDPSHLSPAEALMARLDLYRRSRRGARISFNDQDPQLDALRLSGAVRVDTHPGRTGGISGRLVVRNRIYERVFDERWVAAQMPDAERQRQRAAYRRGLVRASALYGAVSLAMGALALVAFRENQRGNVLLGRYRQAAQQARSSADRANRGESSARAEAAKALTARSRAVSERQKADRARLRMERLAEERRKLQLLADAARSRADGSATAARLAAGRAQHAELRAVTEAENARGQLFIAQMSLMQQASDAGNIGRARELLAAQEPPPGKKDLRDFDWRLFWRRCSSGDLFTLRGHKGSVSWTDFTPGGDLLATSGFDHTIRLWDTASHRQLAELDAHKNWVTCVAFSPDGRQLASSGDDGQVLLWDVRRRQVTRTFKCREGEWPTNLAWSPQGDRLVWVTTTGGLYTARATAGAASPRRSIVRNTLMTVAFSPDGASLLCGGLLPRFFLLDGRKLNTLRTIDSGTRDVWRIAFSPNGRHIASSGQDGAIRIWDPATFRNIQTLKAHQLGVGGLSFSPDSRLLVSGSFDQTVRLWNVAEGTEQVSLTGHTGLVGCVRFSPNGKSVISASADTTARFWDAAALPNTRTVPQEARASSAAVVVSRRRGLVAAVTIADDPKIQVWKAAHPEQTWQLTAAGMARCESIAISPDDRWIAATDKKQLRVWDLRSRAPVTTLSTPGEERALCFSPDGKLLATADRRGGMIRFRDTRTWQVIREAKALAANTAGFPRLEFTPDGRTLVANGLDGSLRLFRVSDGRVVGNIVCPGGYVRAFRLSPDGRLIASSSPDGSIQLWDRSTLRKVADLVGHRTAVLALAFSPSGRNLVSASDDTMKFWSVALRQEVVTLSNVGAQVMDVEFTPDQLRLVTRERRGELRVYEAAAPLRAPLPPRRSSTANQKPRPAPVAVSSASPPA